MKRIIPVRIIGLSLAMFMTVCSFSNISLFAQGNGRYHDIELEVGGLARTYALYVPEGHDGTEEWPLVFLFHGLRVPVQDQIEISQMYLVADTARFMIVYPQGLEVGHPVWGDGVGWHVPDYYTAIPERNDVEFIERIISDLNAKPEFAIDPDRIHATGYSNGAQMSFYLGCVFSNRIASVAGVAGQMSDYLINQVCEPLRPISVLHIQGTADKGFPSEGNEISLPLEGTAEFWAELNGCNLSPESTYLEDINPDDASTVKLLNYNYCDDGVYEVLLYSIEGGGHTWPGGWLPEYLEWHLPVNRDMNASSEIWNFFKRNPRPSNIMMVEIPDTTFLFALIDEGIDTNKDSLISYTEAEAVISLHVDEKGISDLTGIEAFVNLDTLNCSKNQLSSLDVSKNHYLRKLICAGNNDIDTRGRLTSLNLSSNLLLTDLNCSYNRIADLDLSKNTDLIWLECRQNDLKSLDLTNNTALRGLWCSSNMLSSLFINNTQLKELRCGDNTLPNLDVKNNTQLEILEIGNMSSLDEVCVWETFNRDLIEIDTAGSPNVYFTTECLKKRFICPTKPSWMCLLNRELIPMEII